MKTHRSEQIIIRKNHPKYKIIGINAISYALDMVATNSNNVEFFASFVDDKKQENIVEDGKKNIDNFEKTHGLSDKK